MGPSPPPPQKKRGGQEDSSPTTFRSVSVELCLTKHSKPVLAFSALWIIMHVAFFGCYYCDSQEWLFLAIVARSPALTRRCRTVRSDTLTPISWSSLLMSPDEVRLYSGPILSSVCQSWDVVSLLRPLPVLFSTEPVSWKRLNSFRIPDGVTP